MNELLLDAAGIYKSFPGVNVLKNVQLKIRKGEVHALMGENGAGKSTLVKMFTGVIKQDAGKIIYKGEKLNIQHPKEIQDLGIGIVHQEFNLLPELTVAQNIFIGREPMSKILGIIDERKLNIDAQKILKRLRVNINPTTKVSDLSVAEQQMVEIAKSLSYNCELLIMDEPTAALTDSETDTLFDIIMDLKEQGVAIIYISHRMNELKRIVDRVSILRDGEFIAEYLFEEVTLDKLIQDMVGRKLSAVFPEKLSYSKGRKTLEVKNLCVDGVLKDISFDAYEGEILGISGLMGAGRTELARAIFGADPISSGEIKVDGQKVNIKSPADAVNYGIGYITENRKKDGLALSLSVKENIILSSYINYIKSSKLLDESRVNQDSDQFINKLGIKVVDRNQIVNNLSGGNQQKVVLSKWLCSNSKIIIFDEPTRGIDVGSKFEIYELFYELIKNNVTVIMISSELPEIIGMSDRILVMGEGKITAEIPSDQADQETLTYYAMV